MARRRPASVPTWMLFAIPAVLAVAIIAAILLGGPALGFLVALTAAVVILVVAIRMEPGRKSQAPAKGGDPRGARRRRAAAWRFLVPIAIVVAGTIVILVGDRTVRIIGWGVLAVGVTIAMSLVFLEIGYSEERAYARGEEGRGRNSHAPGA